MFGSGLVVINSFDPRADMRIADVNQMFGSELYLRLLKIPIALEQWPSGQGTGFPIQGSHVQNH